LSPWTDAQGQMRLQAEGVTPGLRRILVPFDGSPVAEHAVRYAADLATAATARLVLVRTADASCWNQTYLQQTRSRLEPAGVSAEVVVARGHSPEALLAEIPHQKPDLIVMTYHGDHGLGHTLFGGVAEAVIAAGLAPVPLLRSDAKQPLRSLVGQKVVVLLDGSALSEVALQPHAS